MQQLDESLRDAQEQVANLSSELEGHKSEITDLKNERDELLDRWQTLDLPTSAKRCNYCGSSVEGKWGAVLNSCGAVRGFPPSVLRSN
jgi:hypothetical protein